MAALESSAVSATQAADQIALGTLAAHELLERHLSRIAQRENDVGAWEYLDPDRSRGQARTVDLAPPEGLLTGIPVGVKDIIDTADMPTSYGSPIYEHHRPVRDAACVALARSAGAILVGKTVTAEFAYFTPGKTANPRDLTRTPGGSSSGSAAAVADGMVPLALGSQTAGSIIRPAAYCGVVGYKPTYGSINTAGTLPFAQTLDTLGGFALSVADVALLVSAVGNRLDLVPIPESETSPRIGIVYTDRSEEASPAAQVVLGSAAERLAKVTRVNEVAIPFDVLNEAHRVVMAFEAGRSLSHEQHNHADLLSPRLRQLLEEAGGIGANEYWFAREQAKHASRVVDSVFADNDALITFSAPDEAPLGLNATGDPVFNRAWSILGLPCIHLPTAAGPNGMPLGIQVVGPFGADASTVAAAAWMEERLPSPWGITG